MKQPIGRFGSFKPARLFKKRSIRSSLADYRIDPQVGLNLWDISNRLGVRFDLVTFLSEEAAEEIQNIIDRDNLPISTCWYFESSSHLAQLLPFMPWVMYVIDHQNPMRYGGRSSTLAGVRRG